MRQESLFERAPVAPEIPGFLLVADFVERSEERELLALLADGPWENNFKRRVQVYGLGYGDSAAPVWVRHFPPWLAALGERVFAAGALERFPENAVINEYVRGAGHRQAPRRSARVLRL